MGKENESKKPAEIDKLSYKGMVAAENYLSGRGYEVLERHFKCRAGQMDLIARIEDCICFIEVKTRAETAKGFPDEAIDARKRDRFERIAAHYLKDHVEETVRVRFDNISIIPTSNDYGLLRYHKNW